MDVPFSVHFDPVDTGPDDEVGNRGVRIAWFDAERYLHRYANQLLERSRVLSVMVADYHMELVDVLDAGQIWPASDAAATDGPTALVLLVAHLIMRRADDACGTVRRSFTQLLAIAPFRGALRCIHAWPSQACPLHAASLQLERRAQQHAAWLRSRWTAPRSAT